MGGRLRLIGALVLVAGSPVAGAVASAPVEGQAAVLFDPRLDRADVARAAALSGADIVRFGALPGSVVVDLPGVEARSALRRAGAWLVADPVILGGCSPSTQEAWT
ncbi:MAG: hypothetical protein ACOC05_09780 [Oceanicaulis sp.]